LAYVVTCLDSFFFLIFLRNFLQYTLKSQNDKIFKDRTLALNCQNWRFFWTLCKFIKTRSNIPSTIPCTLDLLVMSLQGNTAPNIKNPNKHSFYPRRNRKRAENKMRMIFKDERIFID